MEPCTAFPLPGSVRVSVRSVRKLGTNSESKTLSLETLYLEVIPSTGRSPHVMQLSQYQRAGGSKQDLGFSWRPTRAWPGGRQLTAPVQRHAGQGRSVSWRSVAFQEARPLEVQQAEQQQYLRQQHQLRARQATQSAEFRAAAYLRAASFSNIPADRSDFAKRVRLVGLALSCCTPGSADLR